METLRKESLAIVNWHTTIPHQGAASIAWDLHDTELQSYILETAGVGTRKKVSWYHAKLCLL